MISVSWHFFYDWLEISLGMSSLGNLQLFLSSFQSENALQVLDCTQSLASVICFSQQGQDVQMNNFFCVNEFLCCSFVSSRMLAMYSCSGIRLRHTLRLSDCPTSFTVLIWTLPLLLMFYAIKLSAILYSAAASGNLMSASSSSSTHESSDFNSLASDAWLVAHLLFLESNRVHFLVLRICLVLWCGLLSFRGGRLWPSTREDFRQNIFFILLASALLSLLNVASQKRCRTSCLLFTFVFKYSLCRALVRAHTFYGHVSLETLV